MRLCIVGIGGCGGHLAERFLRDQDIALFKQHLGEHLSFGGAKGLWLEADVEETKKQNFFGPLEREYYPGFLITHDVLDPKSKISELLVKDFGVDVKKQGFVRDAVFQKAVFEIIESDRFQKAAFNSDESTIKLPESEHPRKFNPILDHAWECIRQYTVLADSKATDGILFIVSLGGGTGTGFINPITRHIRRERPAYPVFVLCVLTEEGVDYQQGTEEAKRDLGATVSLHDLMTKKVGEGVDGVILIDNQLMIDDFGKNYPAIDDYIYQAMRPFVAERQYPGEDLGSTAMRGRFIAGLNPNLPPILVPCYYRERRRKSSEEHLVEKALSEGKLFRCNPKKAEMAYIFTRGFMKREELIRAVMNETKLPENRINLWRKLGDNHIDEILILLRNPYGEKMGCKVNETLEYRLYRVIKKAIKYMDDPESNLLEEWKKNPEAIEAYFYGEDGMQKRLEKGLENIENGVKPFFLNERNIFESSARDSSISSAGGSGGTVDENEVSKIVEKVLKDKGLIT